MSRPLLLLRPAAQGFTVTLLVALAGCGLSSSRDVAKPAESAPVVEVQSEPASVQGAMVKRRVAPAPMASRLVMNDSIAMQYQTEPREQYQNLTITVLR